MSAIVATGRSDYPNQINNVLCFPGVFRGALDARASEITEEMKLVAAHAIADVIPEDELSEEYIIPSVFDRRVAEAVAARRRRGGAARRRRRGEATSAWTRRRSERPQDRRRLVAASPSARRSGCDETGLPVADPVAGDLVERRCRRCRRSRTSRPALSKSVVSKISLIDLVALVRPGRPRAGSRRAAATSRV